MQFSVFLVYSGPCNHHHYHSGCFHFGAVADNATVYIQVQDCRNIFISLRSVTWKGNAESYYLCLTHRGTAKLFQNGYIILHYQSCTGFQFLYILNFLIAH